jgi:hypothetical protein
VRLTPVLPGDLPTSLALLLTDAFTFSTAAAPAGAPGPLVDPGAGAPSDAPVDGTDTGQEGTAGGR